MKMFSKKVGLALAAGTLVAGSTMAIATPAHATVVPIDFEGDGISFTIEQPGQEVTCAEFDLAGQFDDVANTGVLDDPTVSGCTNPVWGPTIVTPNGEWDFTTGSNVGGTVFNATITNMTIYVSTPSCTFNLAGNVGGTFDTSSQTFEVTATGMEVSSTPAGFLCALIPVSQGQDIEIEGTWTNTGGTITLP